MFRRLSRLLSPVQVYNTDMVSKHLQIVFAFIGYINARDGDNMAKLLSDNFVNKARPVASVGLFAEPVGKDVYIKRFLDAPIRFYNVSLDYDYSPSSLFVV